MTSDEEPEEVESSEPVDLAEVTGSRLTPLALEAIELHEYFCAFVTGGFTEDQALRIVSNMFSMGGSAPMMTIVQLDEDDLDEDGLED